VISNRWLRKRRAHWERLEGLLTGLRGRPLSSLDHASLRELAQLYRQAAADLAFVREVDESRRLAEYLNELLGRAHNLLYVNRRSGLAGAGRFFRETFPRTVRETAPLALVSAALFALAALAAAVATHRDPAFARLLLGDVMMEKIESRTMWTGSIVALKPLASSAIMRNNISVALATAGSGILAGLPTLLLMIFNGLLLGTIGAACGESGMALPFWSFVAPHGVLEITAIFLAGAAGLEIARGLLFPGLLPRRDAVVAGGARAARLVAGLVPMLAIAGVIEAFVSPTGLPAGAKFSFAGVAAALLAFYFARSGRSVRSDPAP
jgi:uncharacterized membrane protein SpoIIM required for sporulation